MLNHNWQKMLFYGHAMLKVGNEILGFGDSKPPGECIGPQNNTFEYNTLVQLRVVEEFKIDTIASSSATRLLDAARKTKGKYQMQGKRKDGTFNCLSWVLEVLRHDEQLENKLYKEFPRLHVKSDFIPAISSVPKKQTISDAAKLKFLKIP